MGDAMSSSETTTTENRRRRRSGDVVIELSADDVVDVSNELSEKEGKGKQLKKSGKVKSRTPTAKKGDTTKGKEKESQKKREPSKRKRETSPVHKQNSEQGLGTKQRKDDKEVSKQMIVDNLRLQKVLRGRVFYTEILTKPGMDSLVDLVELQSWTHLFMTKFPVLHEEQVREFYYNVEFAEDDTLHTWVGNKILYLDEELLGKIQGVGLDTVGIVKQSFSLSTLVECECIERKSRPLSKMSQLVLEQDQLKHELEEMTVFVGNKDAKIALLKAQLLKAQTEGPGTKAVKDLRLQNTALLAHNATLQEKAIKDNDEANARLTLAIKSLSHQLPST
ncbi:hypothetical protein KY284_030027 [Solanum tuberosum]|nr:hypothetical protein KY284_030027 [Solanum tuberosum]